MPPLPADMFLYAKEAEFIDFLLSTGHSIKYREIDDNVHLEYRLRTTWVRYIPLKLRLKTANGGMAGLRSIDNYEKQNVKGLLLKKMCTTL